MGGGYGGWGVVGLGRNHLPNSGWTILAQFLDHFDPCALLKLLDHFWGLPLRAGPDIHSILFLLTHVWVRLN